MGEDVTEYMLLSCDEDDDGDEDGDNDGDDYGDDTSDSDRSQLEQVEWFEYINQ